MITTGGKKILFYFFNAAHAMHVFHSFSFGKYNH